MSTFNWNSHFAPFLLHMVYISAMVGSLDFFFPRDIIFPFLSISFMQFSSISVFFFKCGSPSAPAVSMLCLQSAFLFCPDPRLSPSTPALSSTQPGPLTTSPWGSDHAFGVWGSSHHWSGVFYFNVMWPLLLPCMVFY